MRYVLGIDVETTGVDRSDHVIELGMVLFDWHDKKPVIIKNHLISQPVAVPEFISTLTGIRDQDLEVYGVLPTYALQELERLASQADFYMAHNKDFDKSMLEEMAERAGVKLYENCWLDSMVDIDYPSECKTRALKYLAADHGFINPFAHRAVFDVLTMLLVASRYPLETIVQNARELKVLLKAYTQKPWLDDGKSTNLAKNRGYRWDGSEKIWCKQVRESQVESELSHGEFRVEVV